ncbi:MAG: sulfurtransferase TusA family protein [Pseudomonadota bacterium]
MRAPASKTDATERAPGGVVRIDARGFRCPLPVLRLRKIALAAAPGTIFDMVADDPAAARDVPAFCQEMGWTCTPTAELRWTVVTG